MIPDITLYSALVLDFDGVIKDSNRVKLLSFQQCFSGFPDSLLDDIAEHHISNLGLPRASKLELYRTWALTYTTDVPSLDALIARFGALCNAAVVSSEWTHKAPSALSTLSKLLPIYLCTATPDDEIKLILSKLSISSLFADVYGSSFRKSDALLSIRAELPGPNPFLLFVGDSRNDMESANKVGCDFCLFSNNENFNLVQPPLVITSLFDLISNC